MRTLFLRVFLWFWLAMALVIGAFLLATELSRSRDQFPRNSITDKYTAFIAKTAAIIYERDGREGLARYLQRIEKETGLSPRLFDAEGSELSGLNELPGARRMAERVSQAGAPVFNPHGEKFLLGFPTVTNAGRGYAFVGQHTAPFRPPPVDLWSLVPRVLAALLVAGLLCYLLARYIVSPVVKLRAVTRQVSGGDLSARVGPLLGRRRDELAEMGRDFDSMAERVETLVSAQQRLIQDISHELRSPLARLRVALELARRRAGADAAPSLDRMEREAESMNELIGQLLTLSRAESGTVGVLKSPVDLGVLVKEVADDADFEARARNRSVRVTACEGQTAAGSAGLLRSAVENVVRNAVRHTAEGSEVEIALRRGGAEDGGANYAAIRVRDHGPGVPADAVERIFQPFYRVEDARDRQTGGAGLGLAIATRAVRLHGGTIKASNAPGGGLEVEIRLPTSEGMRDEG